jgi:hypothetical protein
MVSKRRRRIDVDNVEAKVSDLPLHKNYLLNLEVLGVYNFIYSSKDQRPKA